mmetsp:Transcript_43094/g.125408  ORF Transcript_43094/g.125408 Transcript_43094/m.125408 type:complete len:200 (+) Transcript_43094:2570-3169(+)
MLNTEIHFKILVSRPARAATLVARTARNNAPSTFPSSESLNFPALPNKKEISKTIEQVPRMSIQKKDDHGYSRCSTKQVTMISTMKSTVTVIINVSKMAFPGLSLISQIVQTPPPKSAKLSAVTCKAMNILLYNNGFRIFLILTCCCFDLVSVGQFSSWPAAARAPPVGTVKLPPSCGWASFAVVGAGPLPRCASSAAA